jgi:hypothetical protein
MTLQGSQMEADDPITSYMLQVCLNLKPCSQFFWQFNFFSHLIYLFASVGMGKTV